MSTTTRAPSLTRELCAALVLSLAGGALFASLGLVAPFEAATRAVVAVLALAYVCYRLSRSEEPTGRIVVLVLWCALAAGAWILDLPLGTYLVTHVALLWLVRSLYGHNGLLGAAADLGLTAVSLSFAVWAAMRTQSFFFAAWCFFLLQAAHVWTCRFDRKAERAGDGDENRIFNSALHAAEDALRRMTSAR